VRDRRLIDRLHRLVLDLWSMPTLPGLFRSRCPLRLFFNSYIRRGIACGRRAIPIVYSYAPYSKLLFWKWPACAAWRIQLSYTCGLLPLTVKRLRSEIVSATGFSGEDVFVCYEVRGCPFLSSMVVKRVYLDNHITKATIQSPILIVSLYPIVPLHFDRFGCRSCCRTAGNFVQVSQSQCL